MDVESILEQVLNPYRNPRVRGIKTFSPLNSLGDASCIDVQVKTREERASTTCRRRRSGGSAGEGVFIRARPLPAPYY